jgi:hypothetical protein
MYIDNQSLSVPRNKKNTKTTTAWRKPAHKNIRIEISNEKLLRLLDQGMLCAADFRCLDCDSKNGVREICLRSCLSAPAARIKETPSV